MTDVEKRKVLAETPTACLINDINIAMSNFGKDMALILDELQLRLMQEEGQENEGGR